METSNKFNPKGRLNLSIADCQAIIADLLNAEIIDESDLQQKDISKAEKCFLEIVNPYGRIQLLIFEYQNTIYKYPVPNDIWDKHTIGKKVSGCPAYSHQKRVEIVKKAMSLGYTRLLDPSPQYYMADIRNYARAFQFLQNRNAL